MPAAAPLTLPVLFTLASFGSCEAPEPPRISVVPQHNEIKYDFSKTRQDLMNFKIDTISPYAAHEHAQVGGLMGGAVKVKSDMNIAWSVSALTDAGCYWYKDIKIIIESDPTIYIAREYPKGSCQHQAILEHERRHVLTDRRVVGEYMPQIEASVRAAVAKRPSVGPVKGDPEDVQKQMAGHIDRAVSEAVDKMYAERRRRQQALDSREEYDRISGSCPHTR